MPMPTPSSDYATVVVPPATAGTVNPTYPRQMFNSATQAYAFVADATQQAALVAQDSNWSPTDPFTTT